MNLFLPSSDRRTYENNTTIAFLTAIQIFIPKPISMIDVAVLARSTIHRQVDYYFSPSSICVCVVRPSIRQLFFAVYFGYQSTDVSVSRDGLKTLLSEMTMREAYQLLSQLLTKPNQT